MTLISADAGTARAPLRTTSLGDLLVAAHHDDHPAAGLRRHQLADHVVGDDALRAEHHPDAAGRGHDRPGRRLGGVEDDRGLGAGPGDHRSEGCHQPAALGLEARRGPCLLGDVVAVDDQPGPRQREHLLQQCRGRRGAGRRSGIDAGELRLHGVPRRTARRPGAPSSRRRPVADSTTASSSSRARIVPASRSERESRRVAASPDSASSSWARRRRTSASAALVAASAAATASSRAARARVPLLLGGPQHAAGLPEPLAQHLVVGPGALELLAGARPAASPAPPGGRPPVRRVGRARPAPGRRARPPRPVVSTTPSTTVSQPSSRVSQARAAASSGSSLSSGRAATWTAAWPRKSSSARASQISPPPESCPTSGCEAGDLAQRRGQRRDRGQHSGDQRPPPAGAAARAARPGPSRASRHPAAGSPAVSAEARSTISMASVRPHHRHETASTVLGEHGLLLDLVVSGEVEVPVLGRTPGAGDVEAGEVAATGAAPALAVAGNAKVGGLVSHGCSSGRGLPVVAGSSARSA